MRRYFGGRAETKSFAVADAAFSGRRQTALEELGSAIGARHSPFPGLPPAVALQVLREGRGELGGLGRCLDRLDRVAERLAV